jgi:hypothetical protein
VIDPVLVYSTYLGSYNDQGHGIAADGSGNVYVTGETYSDDFPGAATSPIQSTKNGSRDVFVAKIDAAGSAIIYATYLGGTGANGQSGTAIAVDSSGNAYVTGLTGPTDFPISENAIQPYYGGGTYDAFVTKINAAGDDLIYSTYLGGSLQDNGASILLIWAASISTPVIALP